MKKYLMDGREVQVKQQVENGYLYQFVYTDEHDEYLIDDVVHFAETLYDKPPTERFYKEIEDLQEEIVELERKRREISELKRKEESLLKDIKKRDFLQNLADYFNENFEYVLYLKNMEILPRRSVYISPYIEVSNYEDKGLNIRIIQNKSYVQYGDPIIRVCKSFKDAQTYAKKELIKQLKENTETDHCPWNSERIKMWLYDIHYSCKLTDDNDIREIYQEKFEQAKIKEAKEKRSRLKKEIEERQRLLNDASYCKY